MDFLMNVLYIFVAILILLFMVTIHEVGHFVAGKIFKFKINEFAVGMGPKIFSRKGKDGCAYSLRAIPLGGFCAFEGEDEDKDSPEAFNNQAGWKRLIVLFSGALFNFISALLIVIVAFSAFGDYLPTINSIYPKDDSTEISQFQDGDTILAINGKEIYLSVDVSSMIKEAGTSSDVLVLRDGKEVLLEGVKKSEYTVTTDTGEHTYVGWGVQLTYGGEQRVKFTVGESIARSVPYCARAATYVLETVGGLFTGLIGLDEIGGPITTIDITSQVVQSGFANILMLITLISVNLAVFNLLPIPSLDGSRMVFVVIEMIRRKPINRKVEGYVHAIGLLLLFALVIVIDLLKFF